LQYGLALSERPEYSFEAVDLGNVYHGVLEIFAGKLAEQQLNWFDFSDEEGARLLREAVDNYAVRYGETILYGSARNEMIIERIYRIILRTVTTLRHQLKQGDFAPERFEAAFSPAEHMESANILLSSAEKMALRGRIDRIDVCEAEDQVYVKVVDYKSGHRRFDLAALYHGLQLQLVVYLNIALEMTKKTHPEKEVIPAAALYYHVSDPVIDEEAEISPEEIAGKLLAELQMTGIVNENEDIIKRLDRDFTTKSRVIPVTRKKDGGYSSTSGVLPPEKFAIISSYVNRKITAMGQQIKAGSIAINPYEIGDDHGCQYCDFKKACDFDPRIPGHRTRKLPKLGRDEALELMKEEV
jgi:ATP-dependent helicase/nuclease subunit B